MALNAGHDRADRRQLDVVISLKAGLVSSTQRMGAVRAGLRQAGHDPVGIVRQLAERAGVALRFFAARRSARLGLHPCEGGVEKLSGVFGGWPNLASSSAIRFLSTPTCSANCASRPNSSAIRSSLESRSSASRFIES